MVALASGFQWSRVGGSRPDLTSDDEKREAMEGDFGDSESTMSSRRECRLLGFRPGAIGTEACLQLLLLLRLLLSEVDDRDEGLFPRESMFVKLSVLPSMLRGGVRGEGRGGRSVGRRTAGVYIGDLGGRSWRVASGR